MFSLARWSKIARSLPGRTDNEIKNYWKTNIRKKSAQVQEGSSQNQLEKAKEDFLFEKKSELISTTRTADKNCNYESYQCGSVEDLWGSSSWDNSSDASGLSADFALTSSPYENRLSDWISEFSNEKIREMNYYDECNSVVESRSSYLEYWTPYDDHGQCGDTWNNSGFLWDMN